MSAAERSPSEPVAAVERHTGSGVSERLQPAIEAARSWAGDGLVALLLSGSHATGEAIWTVHDGHDVSLSDLDLYAVLADERDCVHARVRAREGRARLAEDLAARGLVAPVEVAFVTRAMLRQLPARPGTVELVRSARVVAGDAGVLADLPRVTGADIGSEERLLLLENRAFELLWAHAAARHGLDALRARHAVLKTSLEVAAAHTLAAGTLPASAAERVAAARARGAWVRTPTWLVGSWERLQPVWDAAVAWRQGVVAASASPGEEWRTVVRAWCAQWWEATARPGAPSDPWERALASAARASWPRRMRRSLAAEGLRGLTLAAAGTPQHRLHAAAVVLLLAAAQSSAEPRLPAGAIAALRRLGLSDASVFPTVASRVFAVWDDGLRGGVR